MAERDTVADDMVSDEKVSEETRQAEQAEARSSASADRPPTPDEERRADEQELKPEVAEAARQAGETGADVKGEGQIE